MTTVLRTSLGEVPKRLGDYGVFCGYCLEQFERTVTGATRCPNGCPP